MGEGKKAALFRGCPVGSTMTDDITPFFAAHNVFSVLGEWPPGRRSPRVMEAFMTIRDEQAAVLKENTPEK